MGMNGRSISTNRMSYMSKNEEENSVCVNESFKKESGIKGLSRIGSSNKFAQRERVLPKETEDSLQIFRAL